MIKNILVGLVVIFGIVACHNDDDNRTNCDQITIVNAKEYKNAPNHLLTINSLEINDDCLKVNFSSSGCDGHSWEIKLIDSEDVLKSLPPQRNLRLSLKNIELCQAVIAKELTFDINNLRVEGNEVLLNITNSNDQILYKY